MSSPHPTKEALLRQLDLEAPVEGLGSKAWQRRMMEKLLGKWPLPWREVLHRDLVMLLSDPDSGPRIRRLMRFFLE
jgi:hypothetical protein